MPAKKPVYSGNRSFPGMTRFGTKVALKRSLTNFGIRFGEDSRVRISLRGRTFSYTGLSEAIRGMRHIQGQYEQEQQVLHEVQFFVSQVYSKYKSQFVGKKGKAVSPLKFMTDIERDAIVKKILQIKSNFVRPTLPEKKHFPRQLESFIKIVKKNNINAFIPACESMIANCSKRRKHILRIMSEIRNRENALNAKREGFVERKTIVSKELIAAEEALLAIEKKGTISQKKQIVLDQLQLVEPHIEDWGERAKPEQVENIAIHLINLANVFSRSTRIFGSQQSQIIAASRLVRAKEFSQARKLMKQTIQELEKKQI